MFNIAVERRSASVHVGCKPESNVESESLARSHSLTLQKQIYSLKCFQNLIHSAFSTS